MKKIVLPVLVAFILWFFMFSPWTRNHVNFWVLMSCSAVFFICVSAFAGKDFKKQFSFSIKDILIGIGSAAVLYGIFQLGYFLSKLIFPFTEQQVGNIYSIRNGGSTLYIGLLLAFLIGPAEEIFWRGYVQRTLESYYGSWNAFALAVITYAFVHLWSFNFMLVMSALVCGAFWGLLYKYNKNLVTLMVSHAIWDVSVFILFPIL